jgi:N-acetylmuramoyl-L-alanine amidase
MTAELVIALTIWAEARGEPAVGRVAVASVIFNRAGGRVNRFSDYCRKPRQFSCWNDGGLARIEPFGDSWEHSLEIARKMLDGKFVPITKATHYHAASVSPYWVKEFSFVRTIGNHKFYSKLALHEPAAAGKEAKS